MGHSNKPVERLLALLASARISLLADIRRFPASRRWPQFNRDRLAASLVRSGIDYVHIEALGGRREPSPDSPHTWLRDPGFRGYADYMATPEFGKALDALIDMSKSKRTAIMCAEAVPWRCHRNLVADALVLRGIEVVHLLDGGKREHSLWSPAPTERSSAG